MASDDDSTEIRHAALADLESLTEIYNHYVRESHATFDLVPLSVAQRREWFDEHQETGRYRIVVAVLDDEILGYASTSRFRPKQAYETSVEASVYLRPDALGRRLGRRLYASLLPSIANEDIHRIYAGIALPNPASVALHEAFGFVKVAHFTEQGRKFDCFWDVAVYERPLLFQVSET